ncbi:MAG: hypothetical protein DSM106950_38560 [Stigonema ocellatum SAG 48.90 = DSM 106950]|nr:hypothetical protein [Stigonema ocellatum SAG 48.90 = DSM 106950]
MKPDFSEFSYGFAITKELVDLCGKYLTAAPLFPSLLQEGKIGYDVKLDLAGFPIFLQFKISDYMNNKNAKEVRKGVLHPPFYRMSLRSKRYSNQHDLLLQLENKGNLVYYVAPSFYTRYQFDDYFINNQTALNSVFIKPNQIGIINDYDNHCVSWENDHGSVWRFSTPVQIQQPINFASFTDELISKNTVMIRNSTKLKTNLQESVHEMINILLDKETWLFENGYFQENYNLLMSDRLSQNWNEVPAIILHQIDSLVKVFFGSQIMIVSDRL